MSSQLNETQRKAVESTAEVILCLAGAGTGKTSTLTTRIAHLYENRVGCSSMLALTFTRLAGKEMKERIIKLIGPEGEKLFCNTFHAFSVKVLKEYGYLLRYDKEFTIYDQNDRQSIIETIIKELNYEKDTNAKTIFSILEGSRELDCGEEDEVIKEYHWRLKRNNALDLDMLLTETLKVLTKFPEVQEAYHNQYEYVFVDEFQDSNDIQMKMIQKLNPRNLFVVGDDFQSIYGWRQARPEYIINFSKYYPNCEVIKLEENYRCTEPIIRAANILISQNKNQTEKILKANKDGVDIEYFEAENILNEVNIIASKILEDDKYSNYAILTRTNKQIEPFIQMFKSFNIPFQLISNKEDPLKKYDVRMILNVLEVVLNPKDDATLKKVINFPVKRLNQLKIQEIEKVMIDNSITFMEALEGVEETKDFIGQIDLLHKEIFENGAYNAENAFNAAVEVLELESIYKRENRLNKIEDLNTIAELIARWSKSKKDIGETTDISAFLKWLHIRDIQEKLIEKREAVKIMTVHASKGLEFPTVFVVGMNKCVFPSKRGDLEEERRLFYVAITRAKERLFISRAKKVLSWGNKEIEIRPSQFIDEMRG